MSVRTVGFACTTTAWFPVIAGLVGGRLLIHGRKGGKLFCEIGSRTRGTLRSFLAVRKKLKFLRTILADKLKNRHFLHLQLI